MSILKTFIKSAPAFDSLNRKMNNQFERDDFVAGELRKLQTGAKILDAGCGNQRYRRYCSHLHYMAQDFGQYSTDVKKMMGSDGAGGQDGYKYGALDYVGDIWAIQEADATFDAILCSEVFEHIPYPIDTVAEFARLLKKGGKLILTAPSNCLRHMDPYFFYTGFTDRWFEKILNDNGFRLDSLAAVGDYYRWLAVELARTAEAHSLFAKLMLAPAFLYYFSKAKTQTSVDTLCMGYHIAATKL